MNMIASVAPPALRVAVLVDLAYGPSAGGHVKCWQRLAEAALGFSSQLDLTVFFSGERATTIPVGPNVRYEILPPVFSTRRLAFLTGDIPDHTDLAPWHPELARRLRHGGFDVVHTTDGFFAFTRTAQRVAPRLGIGLVNSIHTATPALTRLFVRKALKRLGPLGSLLADRFHLADWAEASKNAALARHQAKCRFALVSRDDDRQRACRELPPERVRLLRRGIDPHRFAPDFRDRVWLQSEFGVPAEAVLVLYCGRMDPSKNVENLVEGVCLAAARGAPLFLVCAGDGVLRAEAARRLGPLGICPGQIDTDRLARLYAGADLFALPSEIEVFGNVVLESLASGTPVLVAEKGGMGSAITEGCTGLVVRGDGPESWAEVLSALAADPARRAAMRAYVVNDASSSLPTWERVLAEDLLPVWMAAK